MHTSVNSPSDAEREARRTALARLFWRNRLMQSFREGKGTLFEVPTHLTQEQASHLLFGDEALPDYIPIATSSFEFRPTVYGTETYFAVVCDGLVVVPPFAVHGAREDIPPFREEFDYGYRQED